LLSRELNTSWVVTTSPTTCPVIEKLYAHKYLQGVYFGDPIGVPKFPAITVNMASVSSEWLTIDSVKETYNVEIGIFVEDSNQEDTVRFLNKMVDIVSYGLKQHIYPLVADYETTSITSDIVQSGAPVYVVNVADSSVFTPNSGQRVLIEDPWKTEELRVTDIIDATTIRLQTPVCYSYTVSSGTTMIATQRFIYNSWPAEIRYGKVYAGTMLKAATVSWFAWEEVIHDDPPTHPSIV
jgi:hypothetical protein